MVCKEAVETLEHCFFTYSHAIPLWDAIFIIIQELKHLTNRQLMYLDIPTSNKYTFNFKSIIVSEAIYTIWQARNKAVFKEETTSPETLIARFWYKIKIRLKCDKAKLNSQEFDKTWAILNLV